MPCLTFPQPLGFDDCGNLSATDTALDLL